MRSELANHAPAHWARRPIEDVCTRVTSGGTPSRRNGKFYEDGEWAWVKTQELRDCWIDDTEEHITDDAISKSSAKVLPEQTLLLALYGATVGQLGILRRPMTCNQACCAMIVDQEQADFRYLYYALIESRRQLKSLASGAAQQNLSGKLMREFILPFPDLPVQQRIADVLGKLDDKIELNRRMNRTLEKMAAAIFKSWFIDFDPVHAKAEGRDPGLPAEIADLFPDSFEDSALGPIPKGWKAGVIGDVADNPRRTVQPSDVPPATPYIGLQHMPRRCIALDAWGRADEVGSGKSQFKEGEILFGKLRPYFHKVGIAPVDGVCSTDILVVVPKSPEWHSYVLSLVSSKAFVDYTDSHSAGTKMPRTNWKDMGHYPLALPPEPLAKAFQDHVAALHQRIGLAVRQNRRLAGLRDTLLPKLLSGEIELPEAEAIAEEVSL